MSISGANATYEAAAYHEVLTVVTFEGNVVLPGHVVKFVGKEQGTCTGASTLSDEFGGTVDSTHRTFFQLSGAEDYQDSGAYSLCVAKTPSSPLARPPNPTTSWSSLVSNVPPWYPTPPQPSPPQNYMKLIGKLMFMGFW